MRSRATQPQHRNGKKSFVLFFFFLQQIGNRWEAFRSKDLKSLLPISGHCRRLQWIAVRRRLTGQQSSNEIKRNEKRVIINYGPCNCGKANGETTFSSLPGVAQWARPPNCRLHRLPSRRLWARFPASSSARISTPSPIPFSIHFPSFSIHTNCGQFFFFFLFPIRRIETNKQSFPIFRLIKRSDWFDLHKMVGCVRVWAFSTWHRMIA